MTRTQLNVDAVRESAAALGRIMDDMSAFSALRASWPTLGNFDLARQLEAIVHDRRTGVLTHVDHVKISLDEMETALTRIVTNFESIDDGNAQRIRAVMVEPR
jgi:hypothetical protein